MKNHSEVVVDRLPNCDICSAQQVARTAQYDAKLNFGSSWANLCQEHFETFGLGLGLGVGQRLVVRS